MDIRCLKCVKVRKDFLKELLVSDLFFFFLGLKVNLREGIFNLSYYIIKIWTIKSGIKESNTIFNFLKIISNKNDHLRIIDSSFM